RAADRRAQWARRPRRLRRPPALRTLAGPTRARRRSRHRERATRAYARPPRGVVAASPCARGSGARQRLAPRPRPLAPRGAAPPDGLRRHRARRRDLRQLAGARGRGDGATRSGAEEPGRRLNRVEKVFRPASSRRLLAEASLATPTQRTSGLCPGVRFDPGREDAYASVFAPASRKRRAASIA